MRPNVLLASGTFILVILLLVAAAAGVLAPDLYLPFASPEYTQESVGQDLVTLIVGVPLILLGLFWSGKQAPYAAAVWAGGLAFELYVYAIYVFGGVLNNYFFLYVGIAALSLYLLIGVLVTSAAPEWKWRIRGGVLAALFLAIVLMFSAIWIGELSQSISEGHTAPGHLIFVIDLIIVLPAFAVCAAMLILRRPFAPVLSGVLLIKLFTLCASILVGQGLRSLHALPVESGLLGVFTVLIFVSAIGIGLWISGFKRQASQDIATQ